MNALDAAINRALDDAAAANDPTRWQLVRDRRKAMIRALIQADGLDELRVALDEHVRRALAAGEPLPPEVRAYVDAVATTREKEPEIPF